MSENNNEQRMLHRHDIHDGMIDVKDKRTGKPLGKLANVHSEGLLLLCEESVEINETMELQLHTDGDANHEWMDLEVACRWVGETDGTEGYQVGCEILNVDDESLVVLQQLSV